MKIILSIVVKVRNKGLKKLHKYLNSKDLERPKTIIYMNKHGYKMPFLFALNEYYLQGDYGFKFYHSFGLHRTYLDGHNPYMPKDDIDKEDKLGSEAKDLFELLDDGLDGDVDDLVRILEIVLNPDNQPVLFHCLVDVTGQGLSLWCFAIFKEDGGLMVRLKRRKVYNLIQQNMSTINLTT